MLDCPATLSDDEAGILLHSLLRAGEAFVDAYERGDLREAAESQNIEMFTDTQIIEETYRLLMVVRSPKRYMVSEYHWYLLFHIIGGEVDAHNDVWEDYPRFRWIKEEIDFDLLAEAIFWDVDFLTPLATFNNLSKEQKEKTRFDPGLFGVLSGMQPHADELWIKETTRPD